MCIASGYPVLPAPVSSSSASKIICQRLDIPGSWLRRGRAWRWWGRTWGRSSGPAARPARSGTWTWRPGAPPRGRSSERGWIRSTVLHAYMVQGRMAFSVVWGVFGQTQPTLGDILMTSAVGGGRGVPKKQTKGTRLCEFCTWQGGRGSNFVCRRHVSIPLSIDCNPVIWSNFSWTKPPTIKPVSSVLVA